ncbi:hypothetical protein GWK47_000806 [Chionoecetes opilio]|uniref:Uncharacterized protein n=1 Tax=Chionoecetes opilio TaxID=41210 RepID=A0A8J5C9D9_CHIOP|nr:hypothetical protein GWK47_000806 [Chionoecetes opilio]
MPPAGSGAVGTAAWVQSAAIHNATRYTPSPDITPATQQQLWQRPGSIAHHLLQDQGEQPWACRRQRFEAWATSVEGLQQHLRLGGTHSGTLCTPPCNTEVQQRIDARLGKQVFRQLSTRRQRRVEKRVSVHAVSSERGRNSSLSTGIEDSVCAYISQCRAKANGAALGA